MKKILSDLNVICGVYVVAVIADTKVQMRSGRCAGGTAVADNLTLGYILTHGNRILGHVHVYGLIAVAVVDLHIVAGAAVIFCDGDGAGTGCVNGRTLGGSQVHTVVEPLTAINRVGTITKGAGESRVLDRYLPLDAAYSAGAGAAAGRGRLLRLGGGRYGSGQPLLILYLIVLILLVSASWVTLSSSLDSSRAPFSTSSSALAAFTSLAAASSSFRRR